MKRVLVVTYSQTGQLAAITDQILAPLRDDPHVVLHVEALRPRRPFPFPWPLLRFFDSFPESAHLEPCELEPLGLQGDEAFDLIILPYQVWFLAPSQPIAAFLRSAVGRRALAGRPVITVIGCRNMWLAAHGHMCRLLAEAGARLIDNVVLTDEGPTLATLVTTPRWLLTGRRDAFLGLPPAGIAEREIQRCARFGRALRDALAADQERGDGPLLGGLQAVRARPELLASERAGSRSFFIWGKLLRAAGRPGAAARKPLLACYIAFLIAIIVTVVPLSLTVQALLRPLLRQRMARLRECFEQPSGSAADRLSLYDY